ncbi:MAG: hypothetical protein ACRC0V_11255, partial [Fusobacteriaceae bacterium]
SKNIATRGQDEMAKRVVICEKSIIELFEIPGRTVRENYKEAKVSAGNYDLKQVIKIFSNYKNKNSTEIDILESEKNLKESKTKLNETRIKILEQEYIPVDELQEEISNMIFNFKNKLLSIPKKIVVDLEKNKNSSVNKEKIIEKYILSALAELKEYGEEDGN